MRKMCSIALLVILFSSFHVYRLPCQEFYLRYGIYYGKADVKIHNTNWNEFDLMILYPGNPATEYKNLDDPSFLVLMQDMKNAGVQVFLYEDIGCERDAGGKYYSRTDRESWLRFKKREIETFMRYADGILFDCVGPEFGDHVYDDQFGKDVQELIDHVHYCGGDVIVSNLWTVMEWVGAGDLEQIPYKADYVLLEGAWSMTPDQYSDDWNPTNAITFAKTYNFKILGLDYGDMDNRGRIMYCFCASRVFGFSGFYYAEDLFEKVNVLEIPYLGAPLEDYTIEEGVYTREFRRGKVYVDLETHRGWIEGEAAEEEAGAGVFLVLIGVLLGCFWVKKK